MSAPGGGRLPACPARPNCVGSDEPPGPRRVAPFRLRPDRSGGPADAARIGAAIEEAVRGLPGARVVSTGGGRVTAEFRSRLFGFVDDVILEVRAVPGEIAVRSASRLGHWDLGANRRRVERLRARLRDRGIVE